MPGLNRAISGDPRRPPVVFLHGFMGSGADWADVIRDLDDRRRCVAPDLPGHGASVGLLPEAYTTEGAARFVLGVMDGAGTDRATIVGYSMGGRLALYLALRHPDRCAGLFLESASPGLEDETERAARRRSDEGKAERLEGGDFEEFLGDWYRQPLFAPLARDEALLARMLETRRKNDPAELARSLRGMGTGSQPSLWNELPGLGVPTFAVAGELDEKFVRGARKMAERNSCISAHAVPDAGHNVRLEAPGAFLSLLEGFLDSP